MSAFGFTFASLYTLEVDDLWELARLIKGDDHYLPRNKEVLIRGVIYPYFRAASGASAQASRDETLRLTLVRVAKNLGIPGEGWDSVTADWLVQQIRSFWMEAFKKRVSDLTEPERREILRQAEANLTKQAGQMGLSFIPVAGVTAGELSGFGIYLATTTGLKAISTAIGMTFPWAVYQGATTMLGAILGPVGWTLTLGGLAMSGANYFWQRLKRAEEQLKVVVMATIIALGDDPYDWFGLTESASPAEIKKAFRAMVKMFHPDVVPDGAPDWLKHSMNEMYLRTVENYEKIQRFSGGPAG